MTKKNGIPETRQSAASDAREEIYNLITDERQRDEVEYSDLLPRVQEYVSDNFAKVLGEGSAAKERVREIITQFLVKNNLSVKDFSREQLVTRLYDDMAGFSFLTDLIYHTPMIEEVNINSWDDIEIIKSGGRSEKVPTKFTSPGQAIDIVQRMLQNSNVTIDRTVPSVLGNIDKNIRISADIAPIVDDDVGVNASIRIVNAQSMSEETLLKNGNSTKEMLNFLKACVRYGVSVCLAGETGSGKTTVMQWLLSTVPDDYRLITIEDGSREFNSIKKDADGNTINSVVHLLTRHNIENPEYDIDQEILLERTLRKHPDVIGIGEIRAAPECMSVARASQTGHTCVTTLHANSAEEAYERMMTLAKEKNDIADETLMQIMVRAFPIIAYTQQLMSRERRIMQIIEAEDFKNGELKYRTLFEYHVSSNEVKDGKHVISGYFIQKSDISEKLRKRLVRKGISDEELESFVMNKGGDEW